MFLKCWKSHLEAWTPLILMIFPKISSSCWVFLFSTLLTFLTLKMLVGWGGVILTPHLVVFPKRYFLERVKPCFFMAINIIISLTFSENFREIPQVFHMIWRFFPSIITILLFFFSDFLSFPCCKETNEVSIQELM